MPGSSEIQQRDGAHECQSALEAQRLSVRLGRREVLSAVDFRAPGAALSAIIGPNGAGKTTLLRALAGLLPYAGSARCEGTEIASWPAPERARRLAYVPQRSRLTARLSASEVVAQGLFAQRPGFFSLSRTDRERAGAALERVQATHLARRIYPELSGGEQRLVLLARALATGARVILLDEPTASLDVRHSLALFELLEDLAQDGYAIVCVLHDLDDVLRHASHALLLERGHRRACGTLLEPAFRDAIQATYGVRLHDGARLGFTPLG